MFILSETQAEHAWSGACHLLSLSSSWRCQLIQCIPMLHAHKSMSNTRLSIQDG